jgi:hypothetical protein
MSKAEDLLERMRQSPNGWRPDDFARLFKGFGFTRSGTNHDVYIHKKYTNIRATIPRHKPVKSVYAKEAIARIDELKELETKETSQKEQGIQ